MFRAACCFLFALTFSAPARAQSTEFCGALQRVFHEAPSDFSQVRGAQIPSTTGSNHFQTSIPIPLESLGLPTTNIPECYIVLGGGGFWQQACNYTSATEEEAARLVGRIAQSVATCLNSPTLSVDPSAYLDMNSVSVGGRQVGFVRVGYAITLFVANGTFQ